MISGFKLQVEPVHPIHINDELTSLSTIPMPICKTGKLLSDWPEEFLKVSYRYIF